MSTIGSLICIVAAILVVEVGWNATERFIKTKVNHFKSRRRA